MTETLERVHPIVDALTRAQMALSEVGSVEPAYMRAADQVTALTTITAVESQVAELKARLLAALDDAGHVVEESGARDLAFWLHHQTRAGIRAARSEIAFAHDLDAHPQTAAALRSGRVSPAQASVVIAAVDDLPDGAPKDRAEAQLLADAATFDPARLRILGRRILEVVAPEIADAAEAARLEADEAHARDRIRFTFRPLGDGTTRIAGRIPNLAAHQLRVMLDSLLNPRRTPPWAPHRGTEGKPDADGNDTATNQEDAGRSREETDTRWWSLPAPHQLGQAFCELLTRIPAGSLPVHGSTATTLFVTVTLDQLRSGLGAASLLSSTGEDLLSASEARRLACTSGLIPTVLGTKGEVLDLGRTARLFSPAQNKALMLRHRTCQGRGCDHPATHCEAHHHAGWLTGGPTDLDNALLLCNRCHHHAHDPTTTYEVTADGTVDFSRQPAGQHTTPPGTAPPTRERNQRQG
ncbi:HNH endonuclease signature motif containing protein [Nocardioides sp.]|uniref:HNH endonuclease signature motif containing protein n=1 Tax=Nocardioides sp. TaxID=35761 RepID=UPI00262EE329|nr:HNH endonuclease signature motif containing protein [Nocardioides sp.]